jgi:cell wall-associated NlpC family hydrolase
LIRVRSVLLALALAALVAGFQLQPVAAAETEVDGVFRFATRQLNKPFRLGADGLRRYDCSGLVYRTFKENGLTVLIGGDRRAHGYYKWFKARDRVTRNPRKGDLVVWAWRGHRVSHIGIFKGYNRLGKPIAISALVNPWGVTTHKVHSIKIPLKAYLRVRLDR